MSRRGRPNGEVTLALLAAARHGPMTVRALAERALVGYSAARYTASRLVSRGDLVVLRAGRPALVALPETSAAADATSINLATVWWLAMRANGDGAHTVLPDA